MNKTNLLAISSKWIL